ncbi:DUF4242 domain-containing protein [Flavobacteriaceae bacterium GSB9]|nr:DUF4242 domain-containing protein [Flavobacteriaceae bacterium GSB9]
MPIYLDRHEMPNGVTAEHVAEMHQADLKIEHEFNCRGLTYWCDEKRQTAFCLIEAPNKKAIKELHENAHGDVPLRIIEVDENIVESFLGRIEDPEKSQNTELNIINDPAFRVLMAVELSYYFSEIEDLQFNLFAQKLHKNIAETIKKFNGRVVKKDHNNYLISFHSVTDAVLCASNTMNSSNFCKPDSGVVQLNIGLSCGVPVTQKENIFEDTIALSTRMCNFVKEPLVISNDVKLLYESENQNASIDNKLVKTLKPSEEKFLTQFVDFLETTWDNPNLKVNDFGKSLGLSKSQLYRKLTNLSGKSPNNFLKEYRLHKALDLFRNQKGNISEIAFEAGFNSAAYFSKCFLSKYGILPSTYIQQHLA